MKTPSQQEDPTVERWTLIRDIGVLQVKLLVDGLRDLVLVPLSLIAGIASLVSTQGGKPGPYFYQLMAWGKESEHWINLFAAVDNAPDEIEGPPGLGNRDIDEIVGRLESFVKDEVKRGGVTSQAKARLDKILDALERKKKNA
ncbi:MAG: hypothetical protein OEY74_06180 [Gammaproteobacteria bacterium]|nr:hypothetical protein [Gammaproteobacteria bacterium]